MFVCWLRGTTKASSTLRSELRKRLRAFCICLCHLKHEASCSPVSHGPMEGQLSYCIWWPFWAVYQHSFSILMELGLDSGTHMTISHQSVAGSCDHGSSRNWVVLSKIILLSLPKIGIRTAVLSFCSETQDKVSSGSSSGMSLCIDTELMTILRGSMHRGRKAQGTRNCREIRPERLYAVSPKLFIPLDSGS